MYERQSPFEFLRENFTMGFAAGFVLASLMFMGLHKDINDVQSRTTDSSQTDVRTSPL